MNDNPMHYCPGCSHGVVHKLIAEVIEEMGMEDKAIGISPLGSCRTLPHVVHMLTDSLQAYHLAVDFMAATDIHPLPTQILMSSSSCGGSVHCWQSGLMNFTTPCSGAYNSGKIERGEANVLVPGKYVRALVARLLERIETSGSSSVVRPGDFFPGADICKNCPLIVFKKGEKACRGHPFRHAFLF